MRLATTGLSPLPLHAEMCVYQIANGILLPFRTRLREQKRTTQSRFHHQTPGLAVGREFKGGIQRSLHPFQAMYRQGGRQQRCGPATRQREGNCKFLNTGDDAVMLLARQGSPDKVQVNKWHSKGSDPDVCVAASLRGNGKSAF